MLKKSSNLDKMGTLQAEYHLPFSLLTKNIWQFVYFGTIFNFKISTINEIKVAKKSIDKTYNGAKFIINL